MLTSSDRPASAVGNHGRWSEKNVRVSSRLAPLNGSEKLNQNSASAHLVGRGGAELPALVDEPGQRLGQHGGEERGGDQQQRDLADAVAAGGAQARRSRGGRRSGDSVGKSTVATATLKMPWGSM